MPFSSTGTFLSTDADNMLRGLHRNNSDTAHTGNTSETDLKSFTIPGNTIGATGRIEFEAAGTVTGAAGTKRIRVYFGGSLIADTGADTGTADWWFRIILRNTSTGAQRITVLQSDVVDFTNFTKDYLTTTIDTTQNQILKVTVQLGSAADTVTQTVFEVLVVQIT